MPHTVRTDRESGITTASIEFTYIEASALFVTIQRRKRALVDAIRVINRKRSWRDSEKAMAKIPYAEDLARLGALEKKIGEAFNIGGY